MLSRAEVEGADDAVFLLVDELIRLVNAQPWGNQVQVVRRLSPPLRMVWGIFMVDGEVNNGGFNQFFWNDSRRYVREAREGFQLIGATEQLALLDEAVDRNERHAVRLQTYRDADTLEAFSASYDESVFDDLDRRYFQLDTYSVQIAYLRDHLDEIPELDG